MRRRNYFKKSVSTGEGRKKKILQAAGIALGIYLLGSLIMGEMGIAKYYHMKMQHLSLTREIAVLKEDNAKLHKKVYALKNDPAYVERIARDKLGLARPGEIVYYYDEQK